MMIHVPLCRIHSMFTILTGLLSLLLSMRTKIWFYEKANKIVSRLWLLIYKEEFEAVNIIKKSKANSYRDSKKVTNLDQTDVEFKMKLSRSEEETFGWTVWTTVVFMTLFFGFLFNYLF